MEDLEVGLLGRNEVELSERVVPKVGMVLSSEKEVYNLYVEYARQEGFGITKKSWVMMEN